MALLCYIICIICCVWWNDLAEVTLVHSYNMVGIPRPLLVAQMGYSPMHNI